MVQHLSALVHESQQYGYLPGPVEGQEARTRKQERPAAQGSKTHEGFFFGAVKKVSMVRELDHRRSVRPRLVCRKDVGDKISLVSSGAGGGEQNCHVADTDPDLCATFPQGAMNCISASARTRKSA